MHLIWLIGILISLATVSSPVIATGGSDSDRWVDSVYNSMTERQRVAQLFVPRLDISDNSAGRAEISRMAKAGIGGFLLGKGTIEGYANLINLAQDAAEVPLLVTLDGEWGLAMRVEGTPRFPYNIALGAIADERLMADYGREVARECRALGIHVDFAPVMDVNSNPSNPVIGYRSFGENARRVASLGTAFALGMERGGVLTTAKHFPGHGDTSTDSHKTLPVVDHSRRQLDEVDLFPFRSYIGVGLSGVMVGHLCVPVLDPSGTPASMSEAVVTKLLRKDMGFNGLIWTDALAMKGANSAENNCIRALKAGADVLLGSGAPLSDIEAVYQAVQSGKISRAAVEERCRKILAYKYALGLTARPEPIDAAEARRVINAPEAEAVARRLSAAVITCVRNDASILPIRGLKDRDVTIVSLGAKTENDFSTTCRRYADCHLVGAPDGTLSSADVAKLRKIGGVVVVGVFSDSKAVRESLARLDDIADVVPVLFLNPFKISPYAHSLSQHKTLVLALDNTPLLQEYAAQAIFGGIEVSGRLPVNIKGVAKEGAGVTIAKSRLGFTSPGAKGFSDGLTARIDTMVGAAIRSGAFPGCQVLVARKGDVVIDRAYGLTTRGGEPVTSSTLYDIASMTKATATLSGIMKAYDEGLLALDDCLHEYIAETDTMPVGSITLRELLFHQSGLPASLNMFRLMTDTATYAGPLTSRSYGDPYTIKIEQGLYGNSDAQLRSDLVSTVQMPDYDLKIARDLYVGQATLDTIMSRMYRLSVGEKRYRYSDINFCLLMAAEENATGVAHDQWVDLGVFEPIGAYRSLYRAADFVPLSEIAPTEHDGFLRHDTLHGYVHDETASFSGGVQGNAGLFSTAEDIAKLAQTWLNGGCYGTERIFSPETVELFTKTKSPGANRGLGFDRLGKLPEGASRSTYGHTGFTGTCFWIDPENEIIFVFLSNRVNPSRDNAAFASSDIRNRLFAEIYRNIIR